MRLSSFLAIALLAVIAVSLVFIQPKAPVAAETMDEKTAYFAGGCFWGVEHMMDQVPGVISARSGYANGTLENPDYQTVVKGKTGHRETVEVVYNPGLVTLEELVSLYFSAIDPTVQNRQGNDIGTQYQTGIYYLTEEDGEIIRSLAETEKTKHSAFYVEIAPLKSFYPAEEYHQDYLVKNPGGYCHLGQSDFERARQTGRQAPARTAEYRSIRPQDAKAEMDKGAKIIIVDVREPFEFAAGHIKDAINLPLGDLLSLAKEHLPDKDALIYLYCRSGARSRTGAMMLVKEGYTNLYDLGGIINWPYDVVK